MLVVGCADVGIRACVDPMSIWRDGTPQGTPVFRLQVWWWTEYLESDPANQINTYA